MTDQTENCGLTSGALAAGWPSFVTLVTRSRNVSEYEMTFYLRAGLICGGTCLDAPPSTGLTTCRWSSVVNHSASAFTRNMQLKAEPSCISLLTLSDWTKETVLPRMKDW
jgi:hypothetical protein